MVQIEAEPNALRWYALSNEQRARAQVWLIVIPDVMGRILYALCEKPLRLYQLGEEINNTLLALLERIEADTSTPEEIAENTQT